MMNKSHAAQVRLLGTLRRLSNRIGIRMTAAAEQMMERAIRTGVERMVTQKALEHEDRLIMAEHGLQRLLVRMQIECSRLGTFPQVDERAVEAVMRALCPLWPYC